MTFPRASQALSRFTVLDLTRVRSGPTCVRQLADWGANVIKIDALLEDAAGEQPGGPREGSDFQNLHRNKRAMTLNLKDPKGLKVFKRLAEQADVVVENFRPDVKAKLGIDYESVRKINPRIVYGSISGFGQDGPYHKRPGFDQIAQGMGGLMSITGAPGEGRCGSAFRCRSHRRTVLRHRHPHRAFGARSLRRASGCRLRCCKRKYSCWISGRWLMERTSPNRPATTIRPAFDRRLRRPTAISISPRPAAGSGERFAQAIGAPELLTNPVTPARRRVRRIATRSMPRSANSRRNQPRPGSASSTPRACRAADLLDRPDVR